MVCWCYGPITRCVPNKVWIELNWISPNLYLWRRLMEACIKHTDHFKIMPFRLTNAPGVCQALINAKAFFICLTTSWTFSHAIHTQHTQRVCSVLQRLLENKLNFKPEKCESLAPAVSFLGNIIAQGHLRVDPSKIEAVVEWPAPTSHKQLHHSPCFPNFYIRCCYSWGGKGWDPQEANGRSKDWDPLEAGGSHVGWDPLEAGRSSIGWDPLEAGGSSDDRNPLEFAGEGKGWNPQEARGEDESPLDMGGKD